MKKTLTSLLAALVGLGAASAAELTPAQALARVQANAGARKIIGQRGAANPQLIAQLPELYVFSAGDGFMILPADDVAMPLLAYADSGEFAPEEIPALKWWLSTYSDQIAAATAAGISTQADAAAPERAAIAPLLKTTWNQDAPYNILCPQLNGQRSVTGCVATAMAQVMKYYNYPAKGQGSITYNWTNNNNRELSMDFSQATFDWENMADSYSSSSTEAQNLAVATLMKACGYSVEMNYSPASSGASGIAVGSALINYFDYDQGIWQPARDWYDYQEWQDLIYEELAAGRPVVYGGQSATGGHEFVCDGYSSDGFFHFNWGWGGTSDGYFQLNALNPGTQGIGGHAGGYNMGQSVTLGIQPPVAGSKPVYTLSLSANFLPTEATVDLGAYVSFTCPLYNVGATTIPDGTIIAMELTPDNDEEPYYCGFTTKAIEPTWGYSSFSISIPKTLPTGTYTARLGYEVPDGEWQYVHVPQANIKELTATVKNSTISFVAENEPGITISDLPSSKTIYLDSQFSVSFTATNNTDAEYNGSIYPVLFDASSFDAIAYGTSAPLYLAGDESSTKEYVGILYAASGETLTAGNYYLGFVNEMNYRLVSDLIPVTMAEKPADSAVDISDLKFEGLQEGDIAKFTFNATCTKGYYDKNVYLFIWANDYSLVTYKSVSMLLSEGESQSVTCEIDLSNVDSGKYIAEIYHDESWGPEVSFSLLKNTDAIEEISTEGTDAALYDLQGRRVAHPTPGQIYIRGNKLTIY